MFSFNTQLASVTKAGMESQLVNCSLLTNQACDVLQRILALNISIAKASLQQACTAASQLMSGSDPVPIFLRPILTGLELPLEVALPDAIIVPEKSAHAQPAKAVAMLKSVRINPDAVPVLSPPSPATAGDPGS